MKKSNTAQWIKVGAKVLIATWDPFRLNDTDAVVESAREVTITKVGSKYFYVGADSFDKVKQTPTGSLRHNTRVFEGKEAIIEFLLLRKMAHQVEIGISSLSPEKLKLIHALVFPHDTALWDRAQIEDSLETIEWYGIASAMFPGSKFDKINAPAIERAKQELKAATAQFLSIVAQGILAKHINNG